MAIGEIVAQALAGEPLNDQKLIARLTWFPAAIAAIPRSQRPLFGRLAELVRAVEPVKKRTLCQVGSPRGTLPDAALVTSEISVRSRPGTGGTSTAAASRCPGNTWR